ncbi:unnamed protein product [Spirodela intermedia]|uniref:Uncharacterized protein n=1 Tax=Spirodela intermedia TaxID=51605 RepID=A0A7I8J9T2_SPIIN|nr:unnamed protein product [Spirodela intermedia]CAA6666840.1 unnamed protein product [Spirodela intermedia]
MQSQTPFLEDWLRSCSGGGAGGEPPPASHTSSTGRSILHAWAVLREVASAAPPPESGELHSRCLSALQTLVDSRASLHVADPQVKLLLSILSSPSPPPPPQSIPAIFRLLYIWARKSTRPSPSLLQSAVSVLSRLVVSLPGEPFPAHAVLLLGALSASPAIAEESRRSCLELLCRLLQEDLAMGGGLTEGLVPEVLAGIGYALGGAVAGTTLLHGLMILSLLEWVVAGFITSSSMGKIESLCGFFAENLDPGKFPGFAVIMASAGILRAFRRASPNSKLKLTPPLKNSIEGSIAAVADHLISRTADESISGDDPEGHLLLQCTAIGLARCGPFSFHASVLKCVCSALLNEVFPLLSFFGRILQRRNTDAAELTLDQVKAHVGGVLFKEAGAVSGVLCNMYSAADEATQKAVADQIWSYCQEFYRSHRSVSFQLRGGELGSALDEIAEAFFLMVVLFSAEATKKKLTSKLSHGVYSEFSVRVLVSFSCIEYLRRIRLSEYTDAVRGAVLAVQEDPAACSSFIASMPPYSELTNLPGSDLPAGVRYNWAEDEVQTARVLFYLRVIPTCISRIPGDIFVKTVAPPMFLYMHHSLEKVARSSHSVFSAFVTSGIDSDEDDDLGLKEKLVFYYMQRSLEAYPERTPFEGMASGVVALVRHLPAGSPAIFHCISTLMEKASSLCGRAMAEEEDLWKNWQGDSEPCKKVLDLLLRLVTIVDIQVLPYLLKQLAWFVGRLPAEGRNTILGELHALVAESDDVTRKPTLVSWVQSLSYISSQTEAATLRQASGALKNGLFDAHSRL